MILILKLIFCLFCSYLVWKSHHKYNEIIQTHQIVQHNNSDNQSYLDIYQLAKLNNKKPQTTQSQSPTYNFTLDKQSKTILINQNRNNESQNILIKISQLNQNPSVFGLEDAQKIQTISEIGINVIQIYSKFFVLLYNLQTKKICYERYLHNQLEEIFYVDAKRRLWVFSHPNNNVILFRIFDCESDAKFIDDRLVYKNLVPFPEKIVSFNSVISQKKSENVDVISLSLTSFSSSEYTYHFQANKFNLQSRDVSNAYVTNHKTYQIQSRDLLVRLSNKIQQIQWSKFIDEIQQIISFGLFTINNFTNPEQLRLPEKQFTLQALDSTNDLILQINPLLKQASVIKLNEILIPTRTPVFVSKKGYQNLMTFDENVDRIKKLHDSETADLYLYQIETKNLLKMINKFGIYRTLPDSSLNFISFEQNSLNFYPQEHLNSDSYYCIRTSKGGLVFKGSQLMGSYENQPITSLNNDQSIKFGMSQNEFYQQLTSAGIELLPQIYQAHYLYLSLFAINKKTRVQLINGLSGISMLSHYVHAKEGYKISHVFIENNQFWVFQWKKDGLPLITKYQLFFNIKNYKSMLNIKREYQFDVSVGSKIIAVQKCIDTFYYFEYINIQGDNNVYGVVRIQQAQLSNRQPKSHGKYAGKFEKSMILKSENKNTAYLVDILEQHQMSVQIALSKQQIGDIDQWTKLKLKHQYSILPTRVFLKKYSQQQLMYLTYFTVNLRKLMILAYDSEVYKYRMNGYWHLCWLSLTMLGFVMIVIVVDCFRGKSKLVENKTVKGDQKDQKDHKKNQKKPKRQ